MMILTFFPSNCPPVLPACAVRRRLLLWTAMSHPSSLLVSCPSCFSRSDLKEDRFQPRDTILYVPLAPHVFNRHLPHLSCQRRILQVLGGSARDTLRLRIDQKTV